MSKSVKIWLIVALSLVFVGCIVFGSVLLAVKGDYQKLSANKFETNTYQITEKYKDITVITDTADLNFVLSDNSKTSVVCYKEENLKHSVSVKDGALVIELVNTRKWYEYITDVGINFSTPYITVYLPRGEYGALTVKGSTCDVSIANAFKVSSMDVSVSTGYVTNYASIVENVKIKTSTGKITLKDISAKNVILSVSTGNIYASKLNCENIAINVSTGKVHLSDVSCKSLYSEGDTGDILLEKVIATDKFDIERDSGDVRLESCDANEIFIETDTGDVKGILLSEKVFIIETDTGRVDVPKTITGGRCEVSTDTGDITFIIDK